MVSLVWAFTSRLTICCGWHQLSYDRNQMNQINIESNRDIWIVMILIKKITIWLITIIFV